MVFGAGISISVSLDQELKKVQMVDRIAALSVLLVYILKMPTPCFSFLY